MVNRSGSRQIGPIGSGVRLCVGLGLLIAGFGSNPTSLDLAAGFLLLPSAELLAVLLIRPAKSAAFHLYGPIGYAINSALAGRCSSCGRRQRCSFTALPYFLQWPKATPDARSLRCRTSSGAGTISWRAPCSRQSMLLNKRRSARVEHKSLLSAMAIRVPRWSWRLSSSQPQVQKFPMS